jgi:hypothetical protein
MELHCMTSLDHEASRYIQSILSQPGAENWDARFQQTQRVLELLTAHKDVIEQAKSLNSFYLGGLIVRLRDGDLWRHFPGVEEYWEFGEFCRKKLDISLSTATMLERIWIRAERVQMTAEEVEQVGWPTANKILRYALGRADVDVMLQDFREAPSKSEFVEKLQAKAGTQNGNAHTYPRILRFTREDSLTFDSLLEEIARHVGAELHKNMTKEDAVLAVMVLWKQALDQSQKKM